MLSLEDAKPLRSTLKPLGSFILDAFRPRYQLHHFGQHRQSKVAYLDGLRGFAAFIVYWTHYTGYAHNGAVAFKDAFGFEGKNDFATLPIVRLFFHGGAFAVASFFVISGYVLSLSALNQLNNGNDNLRLGKQLGSSYVRRFIRLYTPVFGTIVVFFTIWHVFNVISGEPGHQGPRPTYFLEVRRFFHEFTKGSYFFNGGMGFGAGNYNATMWSIEVEFRGSAIIYTILLTYFALEYESNVRIWFSLGLFVYFLHFVDGAHYSLFLMGMLLCDFDLAAENDRRPKLFRHFESVSKQRWPYYALLLIGLLLASCPHVQSRGDLRAQPGWAPLAVLVPAACRNARWFFATYGSIFVAIAIPRISWLRRFFESQFCQYLGKISFGFYLVHGPCIWIIGDRLLAMVGRPHVWSDQRVPNWIDLFPLTDWGPLGLEFNVLAPQLILLPCTLYFGGVVTKLFDEPSVTLSKWLFQLPSNR